MPKTLNFGSLNIDHVYQVTDFVRPGETIAASRYHRNPGGKGLNQSIALARAGAEVIHAGCIGTDGLFLKQMLEDNGVDCSVLEIVDGIATGHAMIQVSSKGENCIVLHSGANHHITNELIDKAMHKLTPGDCVLLQNEISAMPEIMRAAATAGARIFFNPAPFTPAVKDYPLELVDTIIVNETEAEGLASYGFDTKNCNMLLTLGSKGARHILRGGGSTTDVAAVKAPQVVDTTAAGDTFIGYFLAGLNSGDGIRQAMEAAAAAASWCVAHAGAAPSIPLRNEIRK